MEESPQKGFGSNSTHGLTHEVIEGFKETRAVNRVRFHDFTDRVDKQFLDGLPLPV